MYICLAIVFYFVYKYKLIFSNRPIKTNWFYITLQRSDSDDFIDNINSNINY